ncbi:MAG: hypothetical protein DRR42_14680 [Gammaproteobacteria bacterium]|nr:MAG: hypothetical protein DRR42_14680 [Gammaproteobacteria bacterium]
MSGLRSLLVKYLLFCFIYFSLSPVTFGSEDAVVGTQRAIPVILFTEKELMGSYEVPEPGLNSYSVWDKKGKGPIIDIVLPKLSTGDVKVSSKDTMPVEIDFTASPRGSKPNMTSLSIIVKKGIFSKNISKRFAKFIDGQSILVPAVSLSGYSGRYVFRIGIKDMSGVKSESRFAIQVI